MNEATGLTGGPSGLTGIPKLTIAGFPVATDLGFYYVVWGAALLLFLLAQNLVRSRLGRALRAIHTSETAAAVLGVDTERYKIGVFILSALYAAVAGALYAHYVTFVSPGSFGFHASIQFVTMVVLGGMGSLWGAVAGAVFLTRAPGGPPGDRRLRHPAVRRPADPVHDVPAGGAGGGGRGCGVRALRPGRTAGGIRRGAVVAGARRSSAARGSRCISGA